MWGKGSIYISVIVRSVLQLAQAEDIYIHIVLYAVGCDAVALRTSRWTRYASRRVVELVLAATGIKREIATGSILTQKTERKRNGK